MGKFLNAVRNAGALKITYMVTRIIVFAFWALFALIFAVRCAERYYVYPLGYKEEVAECSAETGIDPLVVFSIIKIESGFDKSETSGAGAVGLMQIMPETGAFVAEMIEMKEFDLSEPKDNVRVGCHYLRYLTEKFSDLSTVVCAYNAGEGNVRKWLADKNYSEDGVTLIRIPFGETERYLDKFIKTFSNYKKLYGNLLDKKF